MNLQSILLLLLVLALAVLALRTYRKTGGSCKCGGNCSCCGGSCPHCGAGKKPDSTGAERKPD